MAALSGILHRIVRVVEDIQEDLLQLLRVAQGWSEIFRRNPQSLPLHGWPKS